MTPDYIALPDPAAATLIASRLQAWDKAQRLSYAETGLMCLEVERRLLWKHYALEDGTPCHSFNHFLRVCCPWSYSTAYAAMRDCKALPDVPADALAEIPQSNFVTMKQISTAYRNRPDVLEASKSLGLDKFMAQTYPEQLIPERTSLRFAPTPDQRADIEDALTRAKAGEDISPTEALWRVAIAYKHLCGDEHEGTSEAMVQ